jgi:hypothetical protein
MHTIKYIFLGLVFSISSLYAKNITIDFNKFLLGALPSEWESTSLWEIQQESDNRVLSMIENKHTMFDFGRGFNICYNKNIKFKDGRISVKFRSNSGQIDQGGGLIWRVLDKDNYYVARFNPLESNFRFYKVIDGNRIELSSASISLKKKWHTMSIVQNKNRFIGYIDDKKLLELIDNSIKQEGFVGVWSKADAKTSFDDLIIKYRHY